MSADRLVEAFRKCGAFSEPYVRTLRAGLAQPHLIPFRFGTVGTVFTVRKALPEEGAPGRFVVEVEEAGVTRLLATEAGPVLDSTGPLRKRSVRLPDAMWSELQRRGDPSSQIREAIRLYLEAAAP